GDRHWRGSLDTAGQFKISDKWTWGWDGTWVSDRNYLYHYGPIPNLQIPTHLLNFRVGYPVSPVYLPGRRGRRHFDGAGALLLWPLACGRPGPTSYRAPGDRS